MEPREGIRVRVVSPDGRGGTDLDVLPERFEVTERGVQVETTFYPWHRVVRFDSFFRQPYLPDPVSDGAPQVTVKVMVDEDGPAPVTYEVKGERFESAPSNVTMLVELETEPDEGTVIMRRLSVPWHRVVEYERVVKRSASSADALPERPDATA